MSIPGYNGHNITQYQSSYHQKKIVEELMRKLRKNGILTSISDNLLFQILSCSEMIPERVSGKVILFQQGDPVSSWYLLISGQIELYLPSSCNLIYSGYHLKTLNSGALFGELQLLTHSCSGRVKKVAEFIKIHHSHFLKIYNKHADYLQQYLTIMQDIVNEKGQLKQFTSGDVNVYNGEEDIPMANNSIPSPGQQNTIGRNINNSINTPFMQQNNPYDIQRYSPNFITSSGRKKRLLPDTNFITSMAQQQHPLLNENFEQPTETWNANGNVFEISKPMNMEKQIIEIGLLLKRTMEVENNELMQSRTYQQRIFENVMFGSEIVDWLEELTDRHLNSSTNSTFSRSHIVGMWQCLLENNIISHVTNELQFKDCRIPYKWTIEDPLEKYFNKKLFRHEFEDNSDQIIKPLINEGLNELDMKQALFLLSSLGPDALFRMILSKPSQERSPEELQFVYSELLHLKALSHLSTMVKRELASVIHFEQHSNAGTILFRQGDEGKSWYIILKGSVDVSIHGKGIVNTLHEGDDFGKLALVNDSPRAATIALREDNSQFLRVDKHDFNRILRDAEANTVRLNEHGKDVLVLEKVNISYKNNINFGGDLSTYPNNTAQTHCCYSVMAGQPEKMLEYILETRIDAVNDDEPLDTFLEDFILTHIIYFHTNLLCSYLKDYYMRKSYLPTRIDGRGFHSIDNDIDLEQRLIAKRRVVWFIKVWQDVLQTSFFLDKIANSFVEEINSCVLEDSQNLPGMQMVVEKMRQIKRIKEIAMKKLNRHPALLLNCGAYSDQAPAPQSALQIDICNQTIYTTENIFITITASIDKTANDLIELCKPRLRFKDDYEQKFLVEIKSNGDRVIFNGTDISIPTVISHNSKLYIVNKEEIDNLTPTDDQNRITWDIPTYVSVFDRLRCSEISQQLTQFHNQLFEATNELELIINVLGRDKFPGQSCSNLDILMRRFNEIQYWCVTEILLGRCHARRVEILKKFIKIANYCKENNDLLSLFAITLGLSSAPISRLTTLWKSLPQKFSRQYSGFESLLDPSRNHRSYRIFISKLTPPIIPFVPLLLKDLTFTHEGNKTYYTGLVNFEKMHMIANVLRSFKDCKASSLGFVPAIKKPEQMHWIKNFIIIDNPKKLMELSYQVEGKKI
uniref:Rap guanine nucleotide exchange factor 1 (inferred by orthology to a C. elegans protein) n=1 Tax=Strongyloides venezuelensis TaxID=75913 RepID=A0A0K0FB67_STRVS